MTQVTKMVAELRRKLARANARVAELEQAQEDQNNYAWQMSEEDREMREAGDQYSRENAERFCVMHRMELLALIGTYSDQVAERKLDELRDQFWSRKWENP